MTIATGNINTVKHEDIDADGKPYQRKDYPRVVEQGEGKPTVIVKSAAEELAYLDKKAAEVAVAEKAAADTANPAPPVPATPLPAVDPRGIAIVETKNYTDGSSATGVAPLPDLSPEQQAAVEAASASQAK
jgi:hypothetical protein